MTGTVRERSGRWKVDGGVYDLRNADDAMVDRVEETAARRRHSMVDIDGRCGCCYVSGVEASNQPTQLGRVNKQIII